MKSKTNPIDTLLESFTTNTQRIHALMGYYSGGLLLVSVLFVAVAVMPSLNQEHHAAIYYVAFAALLGSVATHLADWYYNLQTSKAKAEMLRSYQTMLIEHFLPTDVPPDQVKAVIDDIITPMLGLEK